MRRAIVGNLVGVRPVLLLVLALFVLLGAGPALAQDLVLKTFEIDYYRFGDSVRTVVGADKVPGTDDDKILYASGILCASDADKDIFLKKDGKDYWDNGIKRDGWLNTRRGYVRLLKTTMDRPIIANIERNDQVYLATIIENVTPSIVAALRTGSAENANAAMAHIISLVTADFSSGLFAYHTNRSVYSDLHPTFATSTVAIKSVLSRSLLASEKDGSRVEADKTGDTGSVTASDKINVNTSVVVYWDISGLTVSATDSIQAKQNFSATMAINGGGKTDEERKKRQGASNFIGIETGLNSAPIFLYSWGSDTNRPNLTECDFSVDYKGSTYEDSSLLDADAKRGIFPGVNLGIQISHAQDTTYNPLYGLGDAVVDHDPRLWLDEQFKVGSKDTNLPFQFRTKDKLNVQVEMTTRADLDGEPDMYFGADSDAISFANDGKGSNKFIGGSLAITGWKASDMTNVFNDTKTYSETSDAGLGRDLQGGGYVQTPQEFVNIGLSIADSVITSGTYRPFKVKAAISDEVGSVTYAFTDHAVDTSAPFYTAAQAYAERGEDKNKLANGDVGTTKVDSDDFDEAIFYVGIDGNGESTADDNIEKWLRLSFRDTGRSLAWMKEADHVLEGALGEERRFSDSDAPLNAQSGLYMDDDGIVSTGFVDYLTVDNNTHKTLKVTAEGTYVPGIPAHTGNIFGASVCIRVRNNVTTTINSGGLLVRVMDDARNPAVLRRGNSGDDLNVEEATLETTRAMYSVISTSPLIYNEISGATVEIDNQPPDLTDAQISVLGLPNGYWNSGASTSDIFALLKGSKESAALDDYLDGTKLTGDDLDNDEEKIVKRAAPGDANQNGSPLRVVVKFNPVKDTNLAGEDMDGRPWIAATAAENVAEFSKRFKFNIFKADLGYETDGLGTNYLAGDADKKARWVIQDATISSTYASGDYSTAEVTAIFVDTLGIPQGPAGSVGSGVDNQKLSIQAGDSVANYEDAEDGGASFILDQRKPAYSAYFIPGALSEPIVDSDTAPAVVNPDPVADDGANTKYLSAANTGLYLTTYLNNDNDPAKIPSSEWDKDINEFAIEIDFQEAAPKADRFYNSRDIAGATWPGVRAGDTIIIAGQFKEDDTIAGVDDADAPFNQVGTADSGFPFVWNSTPADGYAIDDAKTLYGKSFKTIAANFGDFIDEDDERDVLPDVIDVYTGNTDPANIDADEVNIEPGKIIVAKWFYYIDGGKSLNLDLAGAVRYVTLTARDLSGNVARQQIAVGTATFSQPQVTILDYEIDTPMLGIRRAVVQRDSSYLGGSGVSAVSLSQATITVNTGDEADTIKSSTVMVVAKIGDGVAKGGPYLTGTKFLKADFTMLGGELEEADQITYADGTPVKDGASISASEIIYATWWSNRFGPGGTDSGGAADKKIRILATAQTLGVGEAEGTAVQLDSTIPAVTVGAIEEKRALDQVATAPSGDQSDDGIIRPNQIVSFGAYYDMDDFDKNYTNLIKFSADMKQFGNPVPLIYTWSGHKDTNNSGAIDSNEKGTDKAVIRGATFQFTVPSSVTTRDYSVIAYATDAAGNFKYTGFETDPISVNATRPRVQSIVMSATSDINYATDFVGTMGKNNNWRNIGTRSVNEPSKILNSEPGGHGSKSGNSIVNAGDWLDVTVQIRISDDVFTDLNVVADFSDFSGDSYKRVVPAPYSGIKDELNNGSANYLIYQGTKVEGGLYTARWIHPIQPADRNISNASVRIIASNPAGVPVENNLMVYSAPLVVDNKAPEVTSKITYYKKGKQLGSDVTEINPNTQLWVAGNWKTDRGYATAAVVVSATYPDSDTMHGNAASMFNALVFPDGWNPASFTDSESGDVKGVEKVNGVAVTPNMVNIGESAVYEKVFSFDPQGTLRANPARPAYFALSDQSGVWNAAGSLTDGPVVSSASDFVNEADNPTWGSTASQLRDSTATVLNIWYGQHPDKSVNLNKANGLYKYDSDIAITFKPDANYGGNNKKLVTSVKDNVGNVGTPSLTAVEIDGMKPFIQIGRIPRNMKGEKLDHSEALYTTVTYADGNGWYGKKTIMGATLDVAPGEPMFNDDGTANYIPAQWAANGNMLRPTRVTQGTKVRLHTYLMDYPDTTDPIVFSLDGRPFNAKASSFDIIQPEVRSDVDYSASGLRRDKKEKDGKGQIQTDYIWTSTFDPTQAASENAVEVIVDIPVNWSKSNPAYSTIQVDDIVANLPADKRSKLNVSSYDNYRAMVKDKVLDLADEVNELDDGVDSGDPDTLASPVMGATDTVGNWRKGMTATVGVEIDTEGPSLVSYYASFAKDKAAADKLSLADIKNIGINASAGAWLCIGATYVVDGTNDLDFPLEGFNVNWAEVFEFDIDRLEHQHNYKGKREIISVTSAPCVIYATNIIKIQDNADPRNADFVTITARDIFGNESEKDTTDQLLAIGARGPVATEVALTVDGKSQTDSQVLFSKLGIGNKGPDASSANFELYPGAKVVVEATVTTIDGEAPDTILLDASDLYPRGLRPMVDELIPTEQRLTNDGIIYCRWETIAYDLEGTKDANGDKIARVRDDVDPDPAEPWKGEELAVFFDQSNVNYLAYNQDPLPRDGSLGDVVGAMPFNAPIAGATPVTKLNLNSIPAAGNSLPTVFGGPKATHNSGTSVANLKAVLSNVEGLPNMQLQKNAAAKRVASVTVYVADGGSQFPFEESLSAIFTVDTEPPRASYVFSVTRNPELPIKEKFVSGWRIGQPTAPNASKDNLKKPSPRVRQQDCVAIIVDITNSLINGAGNDAFRDLPGLLPSDLTTGFFAIKAEDASTVKDVTVDLSGFSSVEGADNMSVVDPDAPVAYPDYPNTVSIIDRGTNKPSVIQAKFSVKVTDDRGKNALVSNDPVEVTPTMVDDAGNRPLDTAYDKNVVMDNTDYVTGNDNNWVRLQALQGRQPVLAVDNRGPSINGSISAQIISGTASVFNTISNETEILGPGDPLENEAVIAAGTVLRVTVTVTDQVDHPLDLVIAKNNFGMMTLQAQGLKLAESTLQAKDSKLSGPDSISVPFEIQVPPKDVGKSTFEFQFIIQATDTVGNMTQISSYERFGFDANPDVEYQDASGVEIASGVVKVNAGPVEQLVARAHAIDVGGVASVEWVADAVEGVTLVVKDVDGNILDDNKLDELTNAQRVDLDLFALIPVGAAGAESFNAHAVVFDNEGNDNELSVLQVNINQPPIIAASIPFSSTNELVINETGEILETLGVGYNAAFADIREVTIEEGTVVNVKIAATDANAADTVTLSATGTAITSPNIIEGVPVSSAGLLDFTFNPGYLAVMGDADSATYALEVKATDGSTVAPDAMSLVFNVLAKSATPIVSIVSQKINGADNDSVFPELNEGSTIEIVMTAQDPGNETLTYSLVPDPVEAPAVVDITVSDEGIIMATFTYTAGLQDADVPNLGYDSPFDPLIASFKVANASFSNEINVPIEIKNVSQAPVITAEASVNGGQGVAVVDGGKISVDKGDNVVIDFTSVDPDGEGIVPPTLTVTPEDYTFSSNSNAPSYSTLATNLTVAVPAVVTTENGTGTIVYTVSDNSNPPKSRTMTLYLVVDTGEQPIGPADIDNVLLANGWGGTNTVNWKNIDPDVTEIDRGDGNMKTVAVTSTYRSVAVAAGNFLAGIGGGADREAYLGLGDLDGDGDMDVALSMGHVTELDATSPNIVVVKDAKTRKLISNSFVAFQKGSDAINYNNGDIPIAVGNFIGSTTADQIACAQGFGGSNIIRIYQYTGREKPNGFAVVAQFNGLSALALTNNANGGVTLAAGDLDGNGRDDLIVGQTNSDTSRTQFASIHFTETGAVDYRTAGVAFAGKRQFQGNGGVNAAVVDLDGDGTTELVFACAGNTKDFTVDVGRNNTLPNVISMVKPVVADGKVTGYSPVASGILQIFVEATSNTGAMSIAPVEGNGLADGKELIFGTKPVLDIDSETASITARVKAARAKYSFVKPVYNAATNKFDGFVQFLGQQSTGYNAFPADLDPAGAGVNVAAGQTD